MKQRITPFISTFAGLALSLTTLMDTPGQAAQGIHKVYGTIVSIDHNNKRFVMRDQNGQDYTVLCLIAQVMVGYAQCPWPTLNDLKVNHQVRAEGWLIDVATIQAYQIEVYNYVCPEHPPNPIFTVINGTIDLITPDPQDPNKGEIVVNNETIVVSSSTIFKGTASGFSGLSVGQMVTVKGKRQTNGKIKARTIKTM